MKACLLFLALLFAPSHVSAQQLPTVDELLPRVVAYAQQYRQSVPSFEADESAVSQLVKAGRIKWEVRLEMTLRELRDESRPGGFVDHYDFNLVDGMPPQKHFKLPYFVQGVFSSAIGFGRPEEQTCYDYRISPGDSASTVRLELWVKTRPLPPNCNDVPEDYRKTLVVDAPTGRILHLTRSMSPRDAHQRHEIVFASVDYAPQKLGDETFLLPVRFESHDEKNEGRMTATYSNFHRYASAAKVVDSGAQPEVAP